MMTIARWFLGVILLAPFAATSAGATTPETQPRKATDFLNTIGVNIHMGMPDVGASGTTYNNTSNVIRELSYIKVMHARDSLLIGRDLGRLRTIHSALGVKFDLVYDDYKPDGGEALLKAALANIRSAADILDAIEGPNEPDWFGVSFDGARKAKGVIAAQQAIYAAVKGDPSLRAIPVYCPALSYPASGGLASSIGNISAYCDYATSHPYTQNTSLGIYLPYDFLTTWTGFPASITAPGRPMVITEGGWTTRPNVAEGVDEATQAKYMLAYLLDAFVLGIQRTYLYELAEEASDPGNTNSEFHYGLFRYDGTPKLAATALANLNALLRGTTNFNPGTFAYSIRGLPSSTGHHVLLQKSDDTFVLALWNEGYLWDPLVHRPMTRPSVAVDVTFDTAPALVQVCDPLQDAHAQQTLVRPPKMTVVVPDHPIFVSIKR